MTPPSAAIAIADDFREGARVTVKIEPETWVQQYLLPHLSTGARILDVGSGAGDILRAATAASAGVCGTGLDISPLRVQQAQARNAGNRHLLFQRGDAQAMPFDSDSFDLVYARLLLQDVRDRERAVGEMVRVCRPGGTVVLQDVDGQLARHPAEDALTQHLMTAAALDLFVGRKLFGFARHAGLENLQITAESYQPVTGTTDPNQNNHGLTYSTVFTVVGAKPR